MNSRARTVLRRILKGTGFFLLFLAILLLALRLPAVQTALARVVANKLAKQSGTEISIQRVAINFIDNACLKGLYIEDQAGDTLIYAGKLEVDIAINRLLRRTIKLNNVQLENSTIHIAEDSSGILNYGFLLTQFASKDTVKKKTGKAFEFLIDKLEIQNLYATTDLRQGYNRAHLGSLLVRVRKLDFGKGLVDLRKIEITRLTGSSLWELPDKNREKKPMKPIAGFPLQHLGIDVRCDKLFIRESRVFYEMGPPQPSETFNARYLHGDELNIDIRDIRLDSTKVTASIRDISLKLNDQVVLKSFSTNAVFAAGESSVNDLSLRFNDSEVDLSAVTKYDQFEELVNLTDATRASASIKNLHVEGGDVHYFIPALSSNKTLEPFLKETLHLTARVDGSLGKAEVASLEAEIGDYKISASGTFGGIANPATMSAEQGKLTAATTVQGLRTLLGPKTITSRMNRFGKVRVNTAFSGKLSDLSIGQLDITTDGLLQVNLSGNIKHLPDVERMTYNLKIHDLRTGHADALGFVDSLPALVANLDTIHYRGTVSGTQYAYDLKGAFVTSLGDLTTDLALSFNRKFTNASYKGELSLDQFALGELLGMDSLGHISLTTTVDGSGLTLDSLNTMLNTHVMALEYNGYLYEHLALNGRFESKKFEGDIIMRDRQLTFDFSGLVDFNDSIPDLKFTAHIDTLDLYALNLVPNPFRLRADVRADIQGLRLDDMKGEVYITDVRMMNDESTWRADTISLVASRTDEGLRQIQLKSPVAAGSVTGRFAMNDMVRMVTDFGDQYFDFSSLLSDSTSTATSRVAAGTEDQHIELSLSLKNPVALTEFFGVGLTRLDTAHLHFLVNKTTNEAELDLYVPSFIYGSVSGDSVHVRFDNEEGTLRGGIRADMVRLSEDVFIPVIRGEVFFADQQAHTRLVLENAEGKTSLELNTLLSSLPGGASLNIQEPFILNDKEWALTSDGPFTFYKSRSEYPDLVLQAGNEAIQVSGNERQIGVELLNFDINNLTELVEFGNLTMGGTMYGHLDIGLVKDLPLVVGDLDILAIHIDDKAIGDLALTAGTQGNEANANLQLTGFDNDISIDADYKIDSRAMSGKADIKQLYIAPFEPFFKDFARESTGYIKGVANVSGTLNAPVLEGTLDIFDVSAFVVAAQTKYTISQGSIKFLEDKIRPRITLTDEEGREAELKGKIEHKNFSDIAFDLKLASEEFTFLNSQRQGDDLYYGKFVGRVNATIQGNMKVPKVKASIATMDDTDVTVQLLSRQAVLQQEEYIVFYDGKSNYSPGQLDSLAIARYKVTSGIDLTLNASIRENATLRLIIDPLTGDNLELRGTADLVVRIPENGDLSITGTYTVDEGNYRFSYQKVLRRNFGIEQGSRIIFTGNPMNARLDIRAKYETQASTTALLEGDPGVLNSAETSTSRRKSDLAVVLNIGGKLSAPDLHFAIELDEGDQSPIGGSVERALARLQQNENELNKQVFSLLLFNSFTATTASGNISSAGSSTAIRSVGNLISNQLNKLAGKAQGFEIDFDLDQYTDALSENGADITEIDLGISQSLLNDKLIISVGGNIGLESGDPNSQTFSNIAGDFVLEYKISKGGKYRVKVFQKTDYDALNDNNLWKTGVGFSYQTKFGRLNFKNQRKLEKKDQK